MMAHYVCYLLPSTHGAPVELAAPTAEAAAIAAATKTQMAGRWVAVHVPPGEPEPVFEVTEQRSYVLAEVPF